MTQSLRYSFLSDNEAGTDSRILAALSMANDGTALPYGADELSLRATAMCCEVFERQVFVFLTPSGTAANGLALAAITPPFGAILCHEGAHILTSEQGASEFYSGGARLVPLPGTHGRFSAKTLSAALARIGEEGLRHPRPTAVSLAQASESGTVYSRTEIEAIAEVARGAGLRLHMDGARFANALVHLGASPAELTWNAGVDVLSFGMTKNGGMNADAVIAFDAKIAGEIRHRLKRAGLAQSKMRFAAAQLLAYLSDGLWLDNAQRANRTAGRLAEALAACPGVDLSQPVEANEVFARLPDPVVEVLANAGIALRPWPHPSGDLVRLVTSFNTDEALVARFLAALGTYSSRPATTPPIN